MLIVREKLTKKAICLFKSGTQITFVPNGLESPDELYMGVSSATHDIVEGDAPSLPLYWVANTLSFDSNVWTVIDQPTYDKFVDGAKQKFIREVQQKRAKEYPSMFDYIDGVVKGDQAQVQAYINACLAVKAKYPKPT